MSEIKEIGYSSAFGAAAMLSLGYYMDSISLKGNTLPADRFANISHLYKVKDQYSLNPKLVISKSKVSFHIIGGAIIGVLLFGLVVRPVYRVLYDIYYNFFGESK